MEQSVQVSDDTVIIKKMSSYVVGVLKDYDSVFVYINDLNSGSTKAIGIDKIVTISDDGYEIQAAKGMVDTDEPIPDESEIN
jgi:hypothetical protein